MEGASGEQSVVLVGNKPPIRYVTACITLLNRGSQEVALRARGKNIERCVRVVEILRKNFVNDVRIDRISIGSEEGFEKEGKKRVSYIEIILKR